MVDGHTEQKTRIRKGRAPKIRKKNNKIVDGRFVTDTRVIHHEINQRWRRRICLCGLGRFIIETAKFSSITRESKDRPTRNTIAFRHRNAHDSARLAQNTIHEIKFKKKKKERVDRDRPWPNDSATALNLLPTKCAGATKANKKERQGFVVYLIFIFFKDDVCDGKRSDQHFIAIYKEIHGCVCVCLLSYFRHIISAGLLFA